MRTITRASGRRASKPRSDTVTISKFCAANTIVAIANKATTVMWTHRIISLSQLAGTAWWLLTPEGHHRTRGSAGKVGPRSNIRWAEQCLCGLRSPAEGSGEATVRRPCDQGVAIHPAPVTNIRPSATCVRLPGKPENHYYSRSRGSDLRKFRMKLLTLSAAAMASLVSSASSTSQPLTTSIARALTMGPLRAPTAMTGAPRARSMPGGLVHRADLPAWLLSWDRPRCARPRRNRA